MPKLTLVDHQGTARTVEVANGTSVMDAAVGNLLPGIDGDCGGNCACATCHVYVAAEWLDRLPALAEMENSMLEMVEERDSRSRLGCQIKLDAALDGIVVDTPSSQH